MVIDVQEKFFIKQTLKFRLKNYFQTFRKKTFCLWWFVCFCQMEEFKKLVKTEVFLIIF